MQLFSSLSDLLSSILSEQYGIRDIAAEWVRPKVAGHGDISTPVSLQLARALGRKPSDIALEIASALRVHPDVDSIDVAGAGYLNVWLTSEALLRSAGQIRSWCIPQPTRRDEAPIVIEYSGPNIAKPLGIHHILSTIVGQSIANLYMHLGYHVETVNHIGDWGTQFGKLFVAYDRWGTKPVEQSSVEDLLKLYVRFHQEAEHNPSLEEEGRQAFVRLEQGDQSLLAFWKTAVDISRRELLAMYDRLHVHIAHQHAESQYESMMRSIVEEGKMKQVFVPGKEGALIAEFPVETNLPPAIVLKADGATIYHTRDLATVRYRVDRWHPQAILHVVDVAQQLYFQQLFAMGKALGWQLPHWEHIIIGRMRFVDQAMSTRKGIFLRLEEVLDEAVERAAAVIRSHRETIQTDDAGQLAEIMGVGAVVYGVLSQNRRSDMVFDWDKFLSFEGNSAPYLQYTHARARSILRKADVTEEIPLPNAGQLEVKERMLINTLLQFRSVQEEACSQHLPHLIANYLHQLCQDFNAFYNDLPILAAEHHTRDLRIFLTVCTASVLKTGAELLTIRVPDRM